MSNSFRSALSVIRDFRKEFVVLNTAFFGLFFSFMLLAFLQPSVQPAVTEALSAVIRADLATEIYLSGNILLAAGATFMVNFAVAALLISLVSLVLPFFGVFFVLVFAAIYGITLSPTGPYAAALIPHSVAIILEFEAYIIAALGAFILGRTAGFPMIVRRHLSGVNFLDGVRKMISLYALVIPLLVMGAIYEAFEILYLVRYFI